MRVKNLSEKWSWSLYNVFFVFVNFFWGGCCFLLFLLFYFSDFSPSGFFLFLFLFSLKFQPYVTFFLFSFFFSFNVMKNCMLIK